MPHMLEAQQYKPDCQEGPARSWHSDPTVPDSLCMTNSLISTA
jgi:hypothetical protein